MRAKKILATTLVATTVLTTTAFAEGAPEWNNNNGEQVVIGDGTVVTPVLEVQLPGDLAFAIDPLKIENNMQIIGGDYNIINYSNVPVKITVNPSIVQSDALNIAASAPELNVTLDSNKTTFGDLASVSGKKNVYLYAIPADVVTKLTDANEDGIYEFSYAAGSATTVGRAAFVAGGTQEAPTWTAAPLAGLASCDTADIVLEATTLNTAGTKKMEFVLETPTFDAEGALDKADNKGITAVASYTVAGCVDPKAVFADGDVQIQAVYKMEILTKNTYATTVGTARANMSTNRLNTIKRN